MGLFTEIPAHNQIDVLKKLDFKEFVEFKKCSKETVEIANQLGHRLPLEASSISFYKDTCELRKKSSTRKIDLRTISEEPVRFKTGLCVVDSLFCQEINVEDFCKKMKFQSKKLAFNDSNREIFEIDSPTIDRLIKILRSTVLLSSNIPPLIITNLEEINQLSGIHFYGEMEESEFLQLKTPFLLIGDTNLPLSAINKFLKQWLEGKRTTDFFAISPIPKEHLDIFRDIEFSVIWSDDDNVKTTLQFEYGNDLEVVYSIGREDGKKLAVAMGHTDIRGIMAKEYEEEEEVTEWIDKQEEKSWGYDSDSD